MYVFVIVHSVDIFEKYWRVDSVFSIFVNSHISVPMKEKNDVYLSFIDFSWTFRQFLVEFEIQQNVWEPHIRLVWLSRIVAPKEFPLNSLKTLWNWENRNQLIAKAWTQSILTSHTYRQGRYN